MGSPAGVIQHRGLVDVVSFVVLRETLQSMGRLPRLHAAEYQKVPKFVGPVGPIRLSELQMVNYIAEALYLRDLWSLGPGTSTKPQICVLSPRNYLHR